MISTFKKLITLVVLMIVVALTLLWAAWPALLVIFFMPSPMWVFDLLAVLWIMFWIIHFTTRKSETPDWADTLLRWSFDD